MNDHPDEYSLLKAALLALLCGFVCLWLVLVIGCGKREQAFTNGQVIPSYGLPLAGFHGDTSYALVRSDALPVMFDDFSAVLFRQGLTRWDGRFDCNHFAALYVALAQARYAVAAYQSSTPAQTLALAEVWYHPDSGRIGHAIVAAMTERGLIYVEPQTGKEIHLTSAQISTAYLVKW